MKPEGMNRRLQLLKYLASDAISALIGWSAFYFYWKHSFQVVPGDVFHLTALNRQFFLGLLIVPFFWLFIHYITGYYNDVYRKSRLSEIWQTFGNVLVGCLFIYFILNINKSDLVYQEGTFSHYP
jgi:4-amino-4-deoxy-L-arabinose transferase-like glycosyltransferase